MTIRDATEVTVNGVTVTRIEKRYTCRCNRNGASRRRRVRCGHGTVTRVAWQTSDGSYHETRRAAIAFQIKINNKEN